MTAQPRTNVRIKARPENTGYVYGSLADRRSAGLDYVTVHFPLAEKTEGRSQYKLDELEEIKP